jgi:phage/plasmid-associated DNA primase
MRELAKSRLAIDDRNLDSDPWLLNVSNGTVDLRTGELNEHDSRDFLTKLAPVEFALGRPARLSRVFSGASSAMMRT